MRLGNSKQSMTQHYSVAQIVKIHAALEPQSGHAEEGTEQREGLGGATPPKVPQERKTPQRHDL